MDIPLMKRLKKRLHVEIGLLQDQLVDIIYNISNGAVFHGGTAIWRCYNGNRFSEDLDFYLNTKDVASFTTNFKEEIFSRGFSLKKFKKTGNLIFSKIANNSIEVQAEFNFSVCKKSIAKSYMKIDGTMFNVLTISPEELILEKISAYKNRKFARDIYDIFHLCNYVKDEEQVSKQINDFLENIEKPIDEKILKSIVYQGAVPSFEQMVFAIKRRFSS